MAERPRLKGTMSQSGGAQCRRGSALSVILVLLYLVPSISAALIPTKCQNLENKNSPEYMELCEEQGQKHPLPTHHKESKTALSRRSSDVQPRAASNNVNENLTSISFIMKCLLVPKDKPKPPECKKSI